MRKSKAFTLTELLIVMGIIIIVAVLAVPSIRAMTGGRSTEAAQNQLSGFLQRARQEAIGVNEIRGVAFIVNADTGKPTAVMVRQVDGPTIGAATGGTLAREFGVVDVYLDAVPDRDMLQLPSGVGIQVADDCNITTTAPAGTIDPSKDVRTDDAYIGINSAAMNGSTFKYGGAILFDGFGRVISKQYAFKCFKQILAGANFTRLPTELANIWKMSIPPADSFASSQDFKPGRTVFANPAPDTTLSKPAIVSAFGFVLFDQDAFDNLFNQDSTRDGDRDPQCDSTMVAYADVAESAWQSSQTGRSPEAIEERWLDANATPLLVNRNNGTLLKGQ